MKTQFFSFTWLGNMRIIHFEILCLLFDICIRFSIEGKTSLREGARHLFMQVDFQRRLLSDFLNYLTAYK